MNREEVLYTLENAISGWYMKNVSDEVLTEKLELYSKMFAQLPPTSKPKTIDLLDGIIPPGHEENFIDLLKVVLPKLDGKGDECIGCGQVFEGQIIFRRHEEDPWDNLKEDAQDR